MKITKFYLKNDIFNKIKECGDNSPDEEVCGIITGKINNNEFNGNNYFQIQNISKQMKLVDYVMNPNDLMEKLQDTTFINKNKTDDWVAIWHTHPRGKPIPSMIDLDRAEYNVVYIIYSPVYNRMMYWGYDKQQQDFYKIKTELFI